METYSDVIINIISKLEIIKKNKNLTYPIGVVLQDNTSYNSLITDLDYKTLYPIHHNYFDSSNVLNNSIPDKIDQNILQLINKNSIEIDNLEKKNIAKTLYNINLDHNDNNEIILTNRGIDYFLSCYDDNYKPIKCNLDMENISRYEFKEKIGIQKKMLFFKSINNEIKGYCSDNSVDTLANILYLLIEYNFKKDNPILFDNTNDYYIILEDKLIKFMKNKQIIIMISFNTVNTVNTVKEYINNINDYYKLFDIILGCKRFGDWYVQKLALINYFFVKTNDFWANIYGLLLGTPCIFHKNKNYFLFNHLPPNNLIELFNEGRSNISIYSYSNIIGKKNIFVYNQNSIIGSENNEKQHGFENLNLFDIDENGKIISEEDFERYYFVKYIKYKHKYLYFKNIKGGDNINKNILIKAIAFFNTNTIQGTVEFEEVSYDFVKVKINLTGFVPESAHGFHVHETGDLTKGCESMCAHFNPYNTTHGGRDDVIRHVGDLGNIIANSEGIINMEFTDHLIKLRGNEANIIGRGLIIHEDEDDCGKTSHKLSKTTGNSGKRIACAIIGYASKCNK